MATVNHHQLLSTVHVCCVHAIISPPLELRQVVDIVCSMGCLKVISEVGNALQCPLVPLGRLGEKPAALGEVHRENIML